MVVFIHSNLLEVTVNGVCFVEEGSYPIFEFILHLVSGSVARICVPLFFFISGFLFFSRADLSDIKHIPAPSFFLGKFRRRISTLLIPYLLWNTACFLLTAALQMFGGNSFLGGDKLVRDYTFADWVAIFWQYKNGMPIDHPLWFMRDLMILTLLTPLIFIVVKHLKATVLALLWLCWETDLWFDGIAGLSIQDLFWFSFGAFFSIHGKDFIKTFAPYRKISLIVFICLVAVETILWEVGSPDTRWHDILYNTGVFAGAITILTWSARGIEKGVLRVSPLLVSSAFFVYAFHSKPLMAMLKVTLPRLYPMNDLTLILAYILIPALVITLGIGLYVILKRYMPRFTNIITGGR